MYAKTLTILKKRQTARPLPAVPSELS
ncbi:hypothetical protein CBM2615_B70126 [Cupriavidus taiwanensis]|uniref:Uncharacterized protein n=1 Tax=Cupriavidus taiwanensis TaxID=164546 RepID=A0A976B2V4_9BURK|nr:hypothetical protein CBM2614_B70028 [Cupriavidus taiwanensis]SOZ70247.1 hypothetical protein CBM2615_B70126 [Cupriavidus taiwanensis]SOZ73121.1 hypothetical protein CBM2613_B50256 [Cupriavidus taiwanensis]SPA10017.1 hypothetical protein CBM2625_B60173 [Cupriavidus taiwanensis]